MHPKTKTVRRRRKPKKSPPMSMTAYADHRGVSRPAVAKALATGRISSAAAAKNARGHWEIHAELADQEWTENSTREKAGEATKRTAAAAATVDPAERLLRFNAASIPVDEDGEPLTRMQVQVIREAALAKQAQLDLAERNGSLVRHEDMKRLVAELGREIMDGVLSVPAKIASDEAGDSDPASCEIRMEQALIQALRVIARTLQKLE